MRLEIKNFDWFTTYTSVVLGWVSSLMIPIAPFIGLSIFLVFTDLYSGTRAAKKRGEQITSKGLSRTVEKIVLYFFCLLASELMTKVFHLPIPVTYIAAMAICMTEFKSMLENVNTVTNVNIFEKIKDLFKRHEDNKKDG